MSPPACPDIGHLQDLLEEGSGRDDALDVEAHLETCADCRHALLTLAADADAWVDAARGLEKRARHEPTLHTLLERLKNEEFLPVEDDLSFLYPAHKPGLLGMLGPYEVEEEIGRGGMGVVLKARDPALDRVVALKVLSPRLAASATARRRFMREGRSAAAVYHEHIVAIYSVNEASGLPYLAMQYVAGESLQDRLDREGPLELLEIVEIARQAATGLAAAHGHGLIHRDIKPANLLLDARDADRGAKGEPVHVAPFPAFRPFRVKITDFGLARMVDDVGMTQNGVVAGTPEYMAPEQARGEPVDHRSDLFSLGSVLYALCAGVSPFHGTTAVAVIHKVCEQEPAPLRSLNPETPDWLERFIARLLAKNPADRFQSTSQVVVLLEGFLAHLREPTTITAPELPLSPAPISPNGRGVGKLVKWRHRFFAPGGFVLSCAVAALAIVFGVGGVGGPEPKETRVVHLPLQGISPDRQGLEFVGPDAKRCVTFEPDGLRITLPAGFPLERPGTGVRIPMPAHGDFEATIHFEILSEPEMAIAGQRPTKLTFQAQLDRREWTSAALVRRMTSDKGLQFTSWTVRETNGNRQTKARQHDAQAKVGRLRIVRRGSEASFYAAEGPDADFTLLPPPRDLGEEDLKSIEFVGSTGNPNAVLDVRLTVLRVTTNLAPPPSTWLTRRSARSVAAVLAACLAGLALCVWPWLRRSRRDQAGALAKI
jgi:serine/threonine protein kinase